MLRFLLFRFLPGRLVPLLTVIEVVLLVWHWRKRNDVRPVAADRRGRSAP
jgi:hypothetical protein